MDEIERFKRIKLHEYATSLGYAIDMVETSRRETVMRRAADKISIRMDQDGHYVYYSFRDEGDHGTIMDFVMGRQGKNFGEARKVLRTYMGVIRDPNLPVFEHLEAAPRSDVETVRSEYGRMKDLRWHEYLEQDRKIPRHVLVSDRFKGQIRVDSRANAIFPHENFDGLCGFEKRNRAFKGFADLGMKGLWHSNRFLDDKRLVIGESAIDCLSYFALFPADDARYASIAGGLNPEQPILISKACEGVEVVCITHPDKDGDHFATVIRDAAGSVPFLSIALRLLRTGMMSCAVWKHHCILFLLSFRGGCWL